MAARCVMAARCCLLLLTAAVFLGLFSPLCSADNVLYSGARLNQGESLLQDNYRLTMQQDCNLVLYDNGQPVWSSGTYGRASYCYLTMQNDGNLVIYTGSGQSIWASNSNTGQGYYVLVLQRDRNLVIYGGAIWATATNAYGAGVQVGGEAAARRNETAPLGSAVVVVNANKEGELGLGRKIGMVTSKE